MDFLKLSPDEAVSKIRTGILNGYKLKDGLMTDYNNGTPQNGEKISRWHKLYGDWINSTSEELKEIYCTELESQRFLNARAISMSIGMEHDFGEARRRHR